MQAIPLTTDARQRMRVTLGNQPVILRAWWQPLSEAWYLSLYTRREEPIALGRQVSMGRRLIEAPGFAGELVTVPLERYGAPIGREAWGQTHGLAYLEPSEIEQVSWAL